MKDADHKKRIAELTKAIEAVGDRLDTDDRKLPNLYLKRADAYCKAPYLAEGDNDIVIADLTQAIELRPDVSVFYYCRGLAYMGIDNYGGKFRGKSEGNRQRAVADFSDAIRLDDGESMVVFI